MLSNEQIEDVVLAVVFEIDSSIHLLMTHPQRSKQNQQYKTNLVKYIKTKIDLYEQDNSSKAFVESKKHGFG